MMALFISSPFSLSSELCRLVGAPTAVPMHSTTSIILKSVMETIFCMFVIFCITILHSVLFHGYSNEAYIQDEQGKRENEELPPPIINGSAIAMSLILISVCVALKSIMV